MGQASGQLECVLQARFTEALMKDKAKVDFSADRIFSTAETGQPKSEVLKQLEQKHPGTSYHFVEDKLGTLDKVGSSGSLASVLAPSNWNLMWTSLFHLLHTQLIARKQMHTLIISKWIIFGLHANCSYGWMLAKAW